MAHKKGFENDSYNDDFQYLLGFNNLHTTEAIKGALPVGQNSPQVCPFGLYAEQINGTAFTAPRSQNQKSWLYRIRPSVGHDEMVPYTKNDKLKASFEEVITPQQIRWMPPALPAQDQKVDFVDGLFTVCGSGSAQVKTGFAIHMYVANTGMGNRAMCNSDGDFLIVAQQGSMTIKTEMGNLLVSPLEICVIPRGIRFSVTPKDGPIRGYIAEIFTGHFVIPDLGPIGANMLANPRDFCYPVAAYEDKDEEHILIQKFQGKLFQFKQMWSPFDVVAWHGNYAPYKYNLKYFAVINTVSFDHPDPSIYTVLTCPSSDYGTAIMDFAIFPPRWSVADHSFKPPYYHRNTASEYMGLIHGSYEAKETGFVPGGGSLHNCMSPHGPEVEAFEKASKQELVPARIADNTMAFMFETNFHMNPTKFAMEQLPIDKDYLNCWKGIKKYFKAPQQQ